MDILFKNKYIRTKDVVKEFYAYTYFQRKWAVVLYVMIAISFCINVICALFGEPYNISIIVSAPVFFAFLFFVYYYQVNTMIKRDNEISGKEIEVETVVTNDFIRCTSSTGANYPVGFDKIKTVIQTKNFILLKTKANLVYSFRKDSFEIGTKEEFLCFLKDKGVSVKIK